jgi:hypothetical protein
MPGRILSAALAAVALAGCAYDTCGGSSCGDPCWVCSYGIPDCGGNRAPDGACQPDGGCGANPYPVCRSTVPQPGP